MNDLAKTNAAPAKRTASEAYEQEKANLFSLAQTLGEELKKHEAKHNANPKSWGPVGDLSHVTKQMTELVAFLQICEPEEVANRLDLYR